MLLGLAHLTPTFWFHLARGGAETDQERQADVKTTVLASGRVIIG